MSLFYIQNACTGLVLDVKGDNPAESTPVIMWNKKGSANQLWTYKNDMFASKLDGNMFLTVSPQGHLVISRSNGGNNQLWYFEGEFIRSGTGKYMDVADCKQCPGATIITYGLNKGGNQKFSLVGA